METEHLSADEGPILRIASPVKTKVFHSPQKILYHQPTFLGTNNAKVYVSMRENRVRIGWQTSSGKMKNIYKRPLPSDKQLCRLSVSEKDSSVQLYLWNMSEGSELSH